MAISVIIPTLNAGTSIEKLISSLLAQDACPAEIIVIDSSSEDNTADTAKKAGAVVIVIPRHEFNHGRTRNMAALKAKGDILVFMTQDALPVDNTLLGKLTGPLRINDIAAAFGRHVPGHDASVLEVFARSFNYPEKGAVKGREDIEKSGIKTFFFSNVCSAIKREPFFKAGAFFSSVSFSMALISSITIFTCACCLNSLYI